MRKAKAITLSEDIISYVERLSQEEGRSFSNMVETIIKRYANISKQFDTKNISGIFFSEKYQQ